MHTLEIQWHGTSVMDNNGVIFIAPGCINSTLCLWQNSMVIPYSEPTRLLISDSFNYPNFLVSTDGNLLWTICTLGHTHQDRAHDNILSYLPVHGRCSWVEFRGWMQNLEKTACITGCDMLQLLGDNQGANARRCSPLQNIIYTNDREGPWYL